MTRGEFQVFREGKRFFLIAGWRAWTVCWLAGLIAWAAPFVPGRENAPARPADSAVTSDAPVVAFPDAEQRADPTASSDSPVTSGLPAAFPETTVPSEQPPAQRDAIIDLTRIWDRAAPEDYARALTLWPLSPVQEQDLARVFADACAHPDPEIARNARAALRDLPPERVFAYVMRTLSWGDADAVYAVDCLLPEVGPAIARMLRATLETEAETERHRCVAAWALGRSGAALATDLLCEYALGASGNLARCCREALRQLRTPEAATVWIELLENRPEEAGPEALAALDSLDTLEAREWIFEAACGRKNIGRYLEEEAVNRIARKPVVHAVPALIAVLEQNRGMREVAAKALRQVTGQPLGTDATLWRAWYEEETGVVLPPPPPPPGTSSSGAVTPPPLVFPGEPMPLVPYPDGGAGPVQDKGDASPAGQTPPARNPKSLRRKP